MSARSTFLPLAFALAVLSVIGCKNEEPEAPPVVALSAERVANLQHLAAQLRMKSLAWDTAFCDSVLPMFQRVEVARAQPQLVIDAHEAALNVYGYRPPDAYTGFHRLVEEVGDDRLRAYQLAHAGMDDLRHGDYGTAMRHGLEALPLARQEGDSAAVSKASWLLGALLCDYLGKPDEALPHLHRFLGLSTRMDDRVTAAHFISEAHWQRDELDLAEQQLAFVERNAVEADSAWPGYPLHRMQAAFLRFVIEARRAAKDPALPLGPVRTAFDAYIGLLKDHSTTRAWNTVSPCVRYADLLIARGAFGMADPVLQLGASFAARCEVCGETMPDLHATFAELYKRTGQPEAALAQMELRVQAMARNELLLARQSVENAAAATAYEQRDRALAIERARERLLADHRLAQERIRRNIFILAGAGLLVFGLVVLGQRRRTQKALRRSDELLLNILPAEVAEELKAKGHADAKHFDKVTILFTDFKGFTEASERMTPQELVEELNTCFKAFDVIITARGIEKIKTIGDAYMCAGGLPDPTSASPAAVVLAGLEMQAFMVKRKAVRGVAGVPAFEMRVGIHTGPVVAGIVGLKKFQYDIWGDTVNIASRMESSGEVGQVNISESTYALVKNEAAFAFTPRGKVQAKGKGELEMYFVRLSREST